MSAVRLIQKTRADMIIKNEMKINEFMKTLIREE